MIRKKPWSCPTALRCCDSEHLEQIAAPREIYNRPATAYTAQFIGHTNLLRGEVQVGIAALRIAVLADTLPDGPALFSLRPENIAACRRICKYQHVQFRGQIQRPGLPWRNRIASGRMRDGLVFSTCAPASSPIRQASCNLNSPPPTRFRCASLAEGEQLMFSRAYRPSSPCPRCCGWRFSAASLCACCSATASGRFPCSDHRAFLDFGNYLDLLQVNVYLQTLFRSMWIAARVMIFSLLLGYPLAYYLSFHAGKRKTFSINS